MPILGIMASQISGHLAPPYDGPYGAYDSLATVTLSASAASITFAGIPSGYKHLQVRLMARSDRATYPLDDNWIQFNGDTGSNYTSHALYGDGASASAYASAPRGNIYGVGSMATSAGSGWSGGILDILDYTNTNKNTTARWLQGFDTNGTVSGYGGRINLISGSWMNTAAVTSITFGLDGTRAYTQHSTFALYGVK